MSFFFFSSRRRHTRLQGDWSSDVCSSDLVGVLVGTRMISTVLGSSKVVSGESVKNTKEFFVSRATREPKSDRVKRPYPRLFAQQVASTPMRIAIYFFNSPRFRAACNIPPRLRAEENPRH